MTHRVAIWGGTSGIGEAIGELIKLTQPPTTVVLSLGIADCDVRNLKEVRRHMLEFKPTHMVYSAGIHDMAWMQDIDTETALDVFDVNVIGFVHVMQALGEVVDEGLAGPMSVLAITSDAAWRPMRTSLAYCASKAALEMAVRVASRELAADGWRINAIAPGKVAHTNMTTYVDDMVMKLRGWTKEQADAYERASSALGRSVHKEEVAAVAVDVLFSTVKAFTGAVIAINGGR